MDPRVLTKEQQLIYLFQERKLLEKLMEQQNGNQPDNDPKNDKGNAGARPQ